MDERGVTTDVGAKMVLSRLTIRSVLIDRMSI